MIEIMAGVVAGLGLAVLICDPEAFGRFFDRLIGRR